MDIIVKKIPTDLTTENVSILTQEVYYTTEKRVKYEIKTEKRTETRFNIEYETKTETKYETRYDVQVKEINGEKVEVRVPYEVEVEVEVQVPVQVPYEVEVDVEVQVPVEFEVEVEHIIEGSNHRCAYSNSEFGRRFLTENEPEDIIAEVMAVWGDTPTVEMPNLEDCVPEPTAEERIAQLEETVAIQEEQLIATDETTIGLYEQIIAQEEINLVHDESIIELYELYGSLIQ